MLRAAVIGCGRMGAERMDRLIGSIPNGWLPMSHAECLQEAGGIDLVALADTDPARLEEVGRRYAVSNLFRDYLRLLDEVRPDIVTVATRTPVKVEIVLNAVRQGVRGIYVEKPLANSLSACRKALAAADAGGVKIGYGVNRRYHAMYRHARKLIADREIGEVVELIAEFGHGQLLWTHPHVVDTFLYLLDSTQVTHAQAYLRDVAVDPKSKNVIDSDPLVDHAHYSFASGAAATITQSGGFNVRIGGTEGTLTIHADGTSMQISRAGGAQRSYFTEHDFISVQSHASATVVALEELRQSVEESMPMPILPAEIETGTRMLLASVWSHLNGGARVALDSVPDDLCVIGNYRDLPA